MLDKKNRYIAQITNIECAICGAITKVNNRNESNVLVLDKHGELLFDCPQCKYVYDIPYKNMNEEEKEG